VNDPHVHHIPYHHDRDPLHHVHDQPYTFHVHDNGHVHHPHHHSWLWLLHFQDRRLLILVLQCMFELQLLFRMILYRGKKMKIMI